MKFKIYHTNDVHSYLENFISLGSYIKENKTDQDLVLDAGDFCDFRDVTMLGTEGKAGVRLLENIGYDAMCIGNNEGFLGVDAIKSITSLSLPILSVNITSLDLSPIEGVLKSTIIQKKDLRFLIIGVSPYTLFNQTDINVFFHLSGLHLQNPLPLIQEEIEKHHNQFDVCILLSHFGHEADCLVANTIKGIDIIIGGHSHTILEEVVKIKNTYIHQAGKYAEGLGIIECEYIDSLHILNSSYVLNTFDMDKELEELIEKQKCLAKENLSEPIYDIPYFSYEVTKECDIVNFTCDALLKKYPCDFSVMHNGIISGSINEFVSKYKLLQLSPSVLNPTRMVVTGQQVIDAFNMSLSEEYCLQDGKGPGFRGNVLGTLSFSHNISIHKNVLYLNGTMLQNDKQYTIITNDYLQRGSGYPPLLTEREDTTYYEGYIRDVLEETLNDKELYAFCKINRNKD